MLSIEVKVNDDPTVLAGLAGIAVLGATVTYVSSHHDLELRVGGLVSHSDVDNEHLEWLTRPLQVGDTIVLRILDVSEADEPVSRQRDKP